MIRGVYSEKGLLSKVLILISFLLVGFGLSTLIGIFSARFIFDLDVINQPFILTDFSNPKAVNALKFMQLLHSLGIFILPILAFAYVVSSNFKDYLSLGDKTAVILILLTTLIMVVAMPLINFMVEINGQMKLPDYLKGIEDWMRQKEDSAEIITQAFMAMENFGSYAANLLVIGLLPAIGEELLFRGFLQKQLYKYAGNIHLAIWISAFLFSAMHLQFYGFLPRFLLGAIFGYLFFWSQSLWIPILAHFINNAGAVTVLYVYGKDYTEEHIDSFGTNSGDWMFLLISFALLGLLLHKFSQYRKVE